MSSYPIISPLSIILVFTGIVLLCLYTFPNPPKLSIEELSVPAFNKSSDQTAGNIYFDLKLRNMNKAIGLYYDDPCSIAFFYYPLEEPYQQYMWASSVPSFYQGNGKTKHIRSLVGKNLQLPSTVVVDPEELVEIEGLSKLLQLPSTLSGNQVVSRTLSVNFRIAMVINYRFKYWAGSSKHHAELAGDVLVDVSTGEKVSTGSIDLVKSAARAGGPVMLIVLFIPLIFIMCS